MAEMENKAPAYREALLVADPSAEPCRRQCKNKDSRMLLVVGVGLLLMAAMFVGGWFAGRQYEKVSEKADANTQQQSEQEQQSQYNNMVRITQTSDGTAITRPVLGGSRPVYDFVQCNYADGTTCLSTNPLLTPKGTIQLTLYQFKGNTTFIVTSTGEQYGELPDASGRRRRAVVDYSNFLRLKNCNGMLETPDKSRPPMSKVDPASEIRVPFSYSSTTSHTHIIHLNGEIPSGGCQLSFENAPEGHHFTIRGGDDILTSDSDSIPVEPNRMTLEDVTKTVTPFADTPIDMEQFKPVKYTTAISSPQGFTMAPLDSATRRKRSWLGTLERDAEGVVYQVVHPLTKVVESTVRVIHHAEHHASAIVYDVINHIQQCRTRFSMLPHPAMRDSHGGVANVSLVKTFTYHHENAQGQRNLSMWQAIMPCLDAAASSFISIINEIPDDLPCIKGELTEMASRVKKQIHISTANAAQNSTSHWKCGIKNSLEYGGSCIFHASECALACAATEVTFGLDLFKAVEECYDAAKSCYDFVHKCVRF